MNKLFDQIEQQNNYIDSTYDQKMHYLRSLEEKVVERFEQDIKLRKELERKALLLIEEKYNFLNYELGKESKNRNESLENFHKIIETDIPKIQINLKDEQTDMIDNNTSLMKRLNLDTQTLINLVLSEKNSREQTEEALLEMLKAMINSMKTQLENEKKER